MTLLENMPSGTLQRTPAPTLVQALAAHGSRVALASADGEVDYAELAQRVDALARRIGPGRLLHVPAGNDVDSVVLYLAGLAARSVVLLTSRDGADAARAVERYDPDIVGRPGSDDLLDLRRDTPAHVLHPDLALLLATSGTTGSPKLVRLSRRGLVANAEAITQSLSLTAWDRAVTTLPVHYCYGLSVLNSHLLCGASVVLTERSVMEPEFWQLVREQGVTNFAGVPYTFELLDRVGFEDLALPSLRLVTQAGGRLDPDAVRRYGELGRRRGWDFVVMYGQTEATARMAYLPADLVLEHPGSIGTPIPGGSFTIDPLTESEPDVGELVYAGPNVMMGYAEHPRDLAAPALLHELRTGDLARRNDAGLFEIVGRKNRFAKVFGLRVDLAHLECLLDQGGVTACCVEVGGRLQVVYERDGRRPSDVGRIAAAAAGLPVHAVHACEIRQLPRSASGKVDLSAVTEFVATLHVAEPTAQAATVEALQQLFARVLDRPVARPTDTFVSLRGDSLSYVELSVALEQLLGKLPDDWQLLTIAELASTATTTAARPRRFAVVDTSVVLRVVAILLVVGQHTGLTTWLGGAHLLLAVAGYNMARFQLASVGRERLRSLLHAALRIFLPAVAWIGAVHAITGEYPWRTLLLVNSIFGDYTTFGPPRHFWFLEVLVQLLLLVAILSALPGTGRLERRWPYATALLVVTGTLAVRYLELVPEDRRLGTAAGICWLFALGWLVARSSDIRRRLFTSLLLVATVPGFAANSEREAIVLIGTLVLLWVPRMSVPRVVTPVLAGLATASLFIYLTHWQVFPELRDHSAALAAVACLVVGVAYKKLWTSGSRWASGLTLRWTTRGSNPRDLASS